MKTRRLILIIVILLAALGYSQPTPGLAKTPSLSLITLPFKVFLPVVVKSAAPPPPPPAPGSISWDAANGSQSMALKPGGDADPKVVSKGSPAAQTRATGNGTALPA